LVIKTFKNSCIAPL